MGLKIW